MTGRVKIWAWMICLTAACSTSSVDAGTREASVRPGINRAYFENPSPEAWQQRFEIESREIWTERERIVAAVGLEDGQDVADVGAGTGFMSRLFAREVLPSGLVYAVDIVPEFLDHIANEAAREGLRNIRTVLGREDSIELLRESVDVVFVCDTYHHFEYPQSTLASIHCALRDGGELVVIDFIRIPGKSRPWVLEHVRAGEDVVTQEIESAGFVKTGEARFLEENYLLKFQKVPTRSP